MPASDYNPNIPQPTDSPSVSQNQILLNWGAIKTLIDVDHVDFAASGAGKHNKITFPVQSPAPTFTGGDLGLYSFLSPVTAVNELYLSTVAAKQVAMSASILSTNAAPSGVAGWSYLPSGILLKWGIAAANGTSVITLPVSGTIPVFAGVSSVLVTGISPAASDQFAYLVTFTPTQITVYGSARTTNTAAAVSFQYLAIGY